MQCPLWVFASPAKQDPLSADATHAFCLARTIPVLTFSVIVEAHMSFVHQRDDSDEVERVRRRQRKRIRRLLVATALHRRRVAAAMVACMGGQGPQGRKWRKENFVGGALVASH